MKKFLFYLIQFTWGLPQNLAGLIGYLALYKKSRHEKSRIHEYGHTIQSLVLGPLYFVVIGFPSILWCNLPPVCRYRKKNNVSYYTLYCEGWANLWGSRFGGQKFITKELLERGRFGKPLKQD